MDCERYSSARRAPIVLDTVLAQRPGGLSGRGAGAHRLCVERGAVWREAFAREAVEGRRCRGLLVVEDYRGNTFRAVYTVRFEEAVYVLHAFQKRSTKGIATSQADRELIARRLKDAIADHEARYGKAKR
jgi:Phage derived protein Gp49-like (DUF891)